MHAGHDEAMHAILPLDMLRLIHSAALLWNSHNFSGFVEPRTPVPGSLVTVAAIWQKLIQYL
jgi:hypothetical protein